MVSQSAAMASLFVLLLRLCSCQGLPDETPSSASCQAPPEGASDQDNEAAVMMQIMANRAKPCGSGDRCCNPNLNQDCPGASGDVPCPNCGTNACACPPIPSPTPTAPTPAPTPTVAPTPTPNWTQGCEWISSDDCRNEDSYACKCRADNPFGPCTNCPGSVPCDTSDCDGAQGTARLTCLQDKKATCCMQGKCQGCSGSVCLFCHDEHRDECCQGYSPAAPACQAPTPAPTPAPAAARQCNIPAGDTCCNPNANQFCQGASGDVACPNCGTDACACP